MAVKLLAKAFIALEIMSPGESGFY